MFAASLAQSERKRTSPVSAPPAPRKNLTPGPAFAGLGNQTALRRLALRKANILQPKLAIGRVDDPLEQEADRIADQVLRMPDQALGTLDQTPSETSTPTQLHRKCSACEEEDELHRHPAPAQSSPHPAASTNEAPPIVHNVLSTAGDPLSANTRAFFEPRIGHDLSQVRIHTGPEAAESARSVAAHAYTVGSHIAFNSGLYSPETPSGRHLLAHELAHVVQQTGDASENTGPTLARAPAAGHCGGAWTCAATPCQTPDIAGTASPSTTWQLDLKIDTDVDSSDNITSGDDVGHTYVVFSESNGTQYSYGFYPNPSEKPDGLMKTSVFGCVVHPDTAHKSCVDYDKTYKITRDQYNAALQFAQLLCKAPPRYELYTWNCTTAAVEIAKQAGQTPPPAKGSVGHGATKADNPNTLKDNYLDQDTPTRHLTSDTEIRDWVASHSAAEIRKIATNEKGRLLNRLLEGWVSDEDVAAFQAICAGISDATERTALQTMTASHVDALHNDDQKARVHAALFNDLTQISGPTPAPAAGASPPSPAPPTK